MKELKFDWDLWNIQKNENKHGVSALEAESCFYDPNLKIYEDKKHSTAREKRYILYSKSMENHILMIGFTTRRNKIRIITARPTSKKERNVYEEET